MAYHRKCDPLALANGLRASAACEILHGAGQPLDRIGTRARRVRSLVRSDQTGSSLARHDGVSTMHTGDHHRAESLIINATKCDHCRRRSDRVAKPGLSALIDQEIGRM